LGVGKKAAYAFIGSFFLLKNPFPRLSHVIAVEQSCYLIRGFPAVVEKTVDTYFNTYYNVTVRGKNK